ncbi:MAG: hypothetical protein R3F24_13405 [Gammaproteobacteria bacterium]
MFTGRPSATLERAPFSIDRNKSLAVVIPFRDRETHLARLLPMLYRQLDTQQINYRIFVVEQEPGKLFNRAKNINGVDVAGLDADYFCFSRCLMHPERSTVVATTVTTIKRLTQADRS